MSAVELGTDVHAQIQVTHRRKTPLVIGHRDGKITPEADERLRAAVDHRLRGLHRIVSVVRRRLKAENVLQTVQEGWGRLLANPDGAVPLNVRVAAQGADTRAGLADIPAQQQQVSDQADVRRAFIVLGNAHSVGNDGGI